MRRFAIGAVLIACMMHGARAHAGDLAAAEAAFAEGRALMTRGNFAEACPKLEKSYELDPAVGTLLNLGECLEKQGRTASAWIRFREAAALAVRQNQGSREQLARERARALEPKLCHLTIRTDRKDLTITRDEIKVEPAAISLRVPVDPGDHKIEATAPEGGSFKRAITITPRTGVCGDTVVDIVLDDGSTPAPPPPKLEPPKPAPPVLAPVILHDEEPPSSWRTMHTLSVVSAGAGVIAAGVGTVFAISASSTKSDADAACTSAGCTPHGHDLMVDAGRSADVATVTIITGAALLATGAVLWFVSPSLRTRTAGLAF